MRLIRDKENDELILVDDNGELLLKMHWVSDEFVWALNTTPITITKDIDEYLYNNLACLMDNDYEFFVSKDLSYKENDRIQWLSDQYVDLENDGEVNAVNRLIVEKQGNCFVLSAYNPFCSQNGIYRSGYVIGFSPAGNGYETRNVTSGTTFQDDIVFLFQSTMNRVNIKNSIAKKK